MSAATTLSPQIAGIMAKRLRTTIHAERVWLFGSLARGHAGIDSDIDLLAVVPASSVSRYQRAVAARRELASFNRPMDFIGMTHSLEILLRLCFPSAPALHSFLPHAVELTPCATEFRTLRRRVGDNAGERYRRLTDAP